MGSSLEVEGLGSSVFWGIILGVKLVSGNWVLLNSITYICEVPISTRLLSVNVFFKIFQAF